jgi:hypothetical protein
VLGFIWFLLFSFENLPLKLFPAFGGTALLLLGLAYPLEGIVVLDRIRQSGASPFGIEIALLGQPASALGVSGQVGLPAGATRASENIPIRHHRAETTLEEQSTGSSFHASFQSSAMQLGDQSRMCANTR